MIASEMFTNKRDLSNQINKAIAYYTVCTVHSQLSILLILDSLQGIRAFGPQGGELRKRAMAVDWYHSCIMLHMWGSRMAAAPSNQQLFQMLSGPAHQNHVHFFLLGGSTIAANHYRHHHLQLGLHFRPARAARPLGEEWLTYYAKISFA